MADDWYVNVSGTERGPISSGVLKQLALEGKVAPNVLVKRGQTGNWVAASHVKGLFAPTTSPPLPIPTSSPPNPIPAANNAVARPVSYQVPTPQQRQNVSRHKEPTPPQEQHYVPIQAVTPLATIARGGSDQDCLIELADRMHCLRERARVVRGQRLRSLMRQWSLTTELSYYAACRGLRGVPVSLLGWRWAVVLVGTTIIGGILYVATFSWIASAVISCVAASVSCCLLYFPSDFAMANTTARLRYETTEVASQRGLRGNNFPVYRPNLVRRRGGIRRYQPMWLYEIESVSN